MCCIGQERVVNDDILEGVTVVWGVLVGGVGGLVGGRGRVMTQFMIGT